MKKIVLITLLLAVILSGCSYHAVPNTYYSEIKSSEEQAWDYLSEFTIEEYQCPKYQEWSKQFGARFWNYVYKYSTDETFPVKILISPSVMVDNKYTVNLSALGVMNQDGNQAQPSIYSSGDYLSDSETDQIIAKAFASVGEIRAYEIYFDVSQHRIGDNIYFSIKNLSCVPQSVQ